MEIWELYDNLRQKTGKTVIRGEYVPDGYYHTVIHVCIFNSNNEMLIQQRQPFKRGWSDLWDLSVGGSAVAGESSLLAATREVKEELGLDICFEGERPAFTVQFSFGFDDVYYIDKDTDVTKLELQYQEVKQAKWAAKDEILKMIDDGSFIPYYRSFIEFIFDFHNTRDVHEKPE